MYSYIILHIIIILCYCICIYIYIYISNRTLDVNGRRCWIWCPSATDSSTTNAADSSVSFITFALCQINNGNRTAWSPIRSVIVRVITKLDDHEAGVQCVNHEYDYRPTSADMKSHKAINHKYYNFRLQVSDYVQVST